MPIFELDEGRPRLVQPMQPLPGSFASDCASLLTHHLSAIAGEPLFPVRRRSDAPEHADLPELLALDPTGRVVVIEVVQVLDDDAVVASLRHAGGAARMTATDLARSYHADPDRFAVDFAAFRDQVAFGMTSSRREGVRLLVLCSEVAPEAGDTLGYLRGPGRHVDILQLGVVRGVDDRRLLEVSPLARHETVRRPVEPTALRLVRSSEASFATAMAYEGERRRPPAPHPGQHPTAGTAPGLPSSSAFPSAPGRPAATSGPARPDQLPDLPTSVPVNATHAGLPYPSAGRPAAPPENRPSHPEPPRTGRQPAVPPAAPPVPPPAARPVPSPAARPVTASADVAGEPVASTRTRQVPAVGTSPAPGAAPHPAPGARATTTEPVAAVPVAAVPVAAVPVAEVPVAGAPVAEEPPAGVVADEVPEQRHEPRGLPYPELAIVAKQRRALATLVWLRERRNQRVVATLRHDGLIELVDGRTFVEPGDAAAAAIGSTAEIDGWRSWRLGDGGPTLAEATGRTGL
ncbi:hypothetical protein KIN34_02855 [Cellulomonas sp. DKR-3]|uniref:RAMA domain-containing protein n=1 Tax=Cellulomonas fulva TaxID=2835530 RepID=A0ABS5TVN9_9CELL|nr:hypothetical protein [Cellulomonas fulva]MBT0993229.1 hypothetical protein [Cellulomonas fulva]